MHRAVERLVAQVGAVLDLQLETADRAETLTGGGGKTAMNASWIAAVFHLQRRCAMAPAGKIRRLALLERLERDEHDAGVGAVGEAVDGQAGERHRVLDARLLQRDVAHPPDHRLGAIERGAIGQLREADQILLVLRRHEAGRHGLEAERRSAASSSSIDERCATDLRRTMPPTPPT